jgi:murein DD-endopeptidase MepM/ murein hydrolase activator NlpD
MENAHPVKLYPRSDDSALGLMALPVKLKPGPYTITVKSAGGETALSAHFTVVDAHFEIQDIHPTKAMKELKPLPGEDDKVAALLATESAKGYWTEPFVDPVPTCMTSSFGVERYYDGKATGNIHRGLDLRSPEGRPVKATTGGVVQIARMFRRHGGTIGLDHGEGVTSLYLHLSRVAVREGTVVRKGTVVGYVGSTGFATGPHLHWSIYVHGQAVNPLQWTPEMKPCAE